MHCNSCFNLSNMHTNQTTFPSLINKRKPLKPKLLNNPSRHMQINCYTVLENRLVYHIGLKTPQ